MVGQKTVKSIRTKNQNKSIQILLSHVSNGKVKEWESYLCDILNVLSVDQLQGKTVTKVWELSKHWIEKKAFHQNGITFSVSSDFLISPV